MPHCNKSELTIVIIEISNNKDFQNSLKEVFIFSQNILSQGKIYNLLTKSYCCVMGNITDNAVNTAKNQFFDVENLLQFLNAKRHLSSDQDSMAAYFCHIDICNVIVVPCSAIGHHLAGTQTHRHRQTNN